MNLEWKRPHTVFLLQPEEETVFHCSEIKSNFNGFSEFTTEIWFWFLAHLQHSKHGYFSIRPVNPQNVQFAMKIYSLKYHYQWLQQAVWCYLVEYGHIIGQLYCKQFQIKLKHHICCQYKYKISRNRDSNKQWLTAQ